MKKILPSTLMVLFYFFNLVHAIAADDIKVAVRDRQASLSFQVVDEGRLLVSVLDGNQEPVRGLTGADFSA